MKIYSQNLNLNDAIQTNNVEIIKSVISTGAQPDYYSLNDAIQINDLEIIKLILSTGAKPNEYSLNKAIVTENLEIIKLILSTGAKPNEYSLNKAIVTDNVEIVKLIISTGAKSNCFSLNHAIQTNNLEIINLIVSTGAQPDCFSLNHAIQTNDLEIVKLIISTGAKPDMVSLSHAIQTNNLEIINLIVSTGAQPDYRSLYDAIQTNNLEIIKLIISTGAQQNEHSLNFAIKTNDVEIVKLILSIGAKPNNYSLNDAIKTKKLEIIKLIISIGAKPNYDSLNHAIATGNLEIIQLIIELVKKDISLIIQNAKNPNKYINLKQELIDYKEYFPSEVDIFERKDICNDLSKFTKKQHYDKKQFIEKVFEKLEEFKKDHEMKTNLNNFNKIFINQCLFFNNASSFYNWLNSFISSSEKLNESLSSNYKREIENWLIEMSTKDSMINQYENLFTLASYIPSFIESEMKKIFDEGMKEIIKQYPNPSRERMEERKKLENKIKNSTKFVIRKENLKQIEMEFNSLEYKRFLKEFENSEDDFFKQSMINLIRYSNSDYEEIIAFVKKITNGSDKANIKPEQFSIQSNGRNFLFKILEKRDPLGLVIGEQPYSGCCFTINGASKSSLLDSFVNPDTGILVVYDDKNNFLAQSWIWLTNDQSTLVLDNVEFATKFKNKSDDDSNLDKLNSIFNEEEYKVNNIDIKTIIQNAYKEFSKIYKQKTGLNVFVGTGYDDLGVKEMNLEVVQNWENMDVYPYIAFNSEVYLADSESVLRLANWYRSYKIRYGI